MINTEILEEIYRLWSQYEKRWGRQIDFGELPNMISQERLLLVLRIIVNTGDSLIVGFVKAKKLLEEYYAYLDNVDGLNDKDIVSERCPICGNEVVYRSFANSLNLNAELSIV